MRYEVDFYIPEDCILHWHRNENLKSNWISGLLSIFQKSKQLSFNSSRINISTIISITICSLVKVAVRR
jgi:hypothetical protein